MKSISYWEKTSFFQSLDVAIIGSGIVGLTTAIFLKQKKPNLKISIFEKGTLPSGASTKNAGFACFGSMTELVDDVKKGDETEVFELVEKRWKGLAMLRQLLGDHNIGFKQLGGFEIFLRNDSHSFEECLCNLENYNQKLKSIIGKNQVFSVRDDLISKFGFERTEHLIFNQAEGQIDTGMMMKNLMAKARNLGIDIWNGIEIKKIEDVGAEARLLVSKDFSIASKKVLVATNGFASQLINGLDLKPARNQVIVTEPIQDLPFDGCFHLDRGYYYFRSVAIKNSSEKRILFGGGRNLSPEEETKASFGETPLIQMNLEKKLHEIICPRKTVKIDMRWSGILGIGKSKNPILEKISPSVYAAVRLGGMGVAIGSSLGKQTCNKILEDF